MAKSLNGFLKEKLGVIGDINYISYVSEQRTINSAKRHKRLMDFSKAAEVFYNKGGKLEEILKNPQMISDLNSNLKFESKEDFEDFIKCFNRLAYTDLGKEYGRIGTPIKDIPREFIETDSLVQVELQKVSYFKTGYNYGLLEYYYNLGLNGTRIEDLSFEFFDGKLKMKDFLEQYQSGLRKYQEQEMGKIR